MNEQSKKNSFISGPWALIVSDFSTPHPPGGYPSRKKSKGPRLCQLELDVLDICRCNPQGPPATIADRERTLLLCARQLFAKGVRRKRARHLNDANIRSLVADWRAQHLSAATIRNRLMYLRWLLEKADKPHLIERSNHAYGAGRSKQSADAKTPRCNTQSSSTPSDLACN